MIVRQLSQPRIEDLLVAAIGHPPGRKTNEQYAVVGHELTSPGEKPPLVRDVLNGVLHQHDVKRPAKAFAGVLIIDASCDERSSSISYGIRYGAFSVLDFFWT